MKRTRTENVPKEVVYLLICDGCGKQGRPDEPGWYEFDSHHGEWGYDSVDSWDRYEVCSADCYLKVVKERFDYWERTGEPPSLKIDGKDRTFLLGLIEVRREKKERSA